MEERARVGGDGPLPGQAEEQPQKSVTRPDRLEENVGSDRHKGRHRNATGPWWKRSAAGVVATALIAAMGLPAIEPARAVVGQGFTVTPADLAFILKQIKISEAHVRNTNSSTGPCGALLGSASNQVPGPLVSYGLRTVDGSCNNLQPGRDSYGEANQKFSRLATPEYSAAEDGAPLGVPGTTTYDSTKNVVDSQPRVISNLVVDQTSTNPAAVSAARFPVRAQAGSEGVVPCDDSGQPEGCVPAGETLDIPNVTTDVGLSPPYNSLFTLFGQFFDHGLDLVDKSGSIVFMPLKADDPLIPGPDGKLNTGDDLSPRMRFMVLTRATNMPGPDGKVGTEDDVREAINRTNPFVDQSQTYASDPSHHVFLREYAVNTANRPVSTGKLISSGDDAMGTWAGLKEQARTKLGLDLADHDVLSVPMLAVDPYGNFIPGPERGLPQYVTPTGMVEGNLTAPVAVPADALRVNEAFLDDIAHNAVPKTPTTPADGDEDINPPGPPTSTYDDEMLDAHFVAGDGRVNENIGLTMIHQVFHSEHNRLVEDIKRVLESDNSSTGPAALTEWKLESGADGWNGDRLLQAARFIAEMEYQHLAFEEFARKIQPLIEPFAGYHDDVNPAIHAEFAHAVYRFGHSMLTDTVSRRNPDGSSNDIPLLNAFLNPPSYTDGGLAGTLTPRQAAGSIAMGMSDQVGSELDEFVTDTLRSNLLGLPLDLAAINMARARETGTPSLNNLRKQIFNTTNDGQLKPYSNWIDFGLNMKHPESLVNFVAAYGQHPSITGVSALAEKRAAAQLIVDPPIDAPSGSVPEDAEAFMGSTGGWANDGSGNSTTGLDKVDLWLGGLAERTNLFGGLLGSTFNYVFEKQMTDLQNGDRFYYLVRTAGMNLLNQLEGNSFAEIIMRNTDATAMTADAFSTADCKFDLRRLTFNGSTVNNDALSECDEQALLIRMPDETIRYRTTNSVDPAGINGQSVFTGTAAMDRIWGGVDNDTFWGDEGIDIIEGNDGADTALGGEGDDIITDSAGDDVLKGGPGNDAINGGPGLDLLLGGDGKDFLNGGANTNEVFGGLGDDMLIAGGGNDTVFGDSGDDWIEGGDGADLMIGDSGAPFFDDPNAPGHDVVVGQNGDDDYDVEGGDDIMLAGPGIERNAGAAGYDWASFQLDPLAADADLALSLLGVPLPAAVLRDRYAETEALTGAEKNDVLRGDSVIPRIVEAEGSSGSNWLDAAGVARISGLAELLPPGATANGKVWGEGNIILGGGGSDTLEGRGADDILDGDKQLRVRLSVRTNPADPATEIGSTTSLGGTYQPNNPATLQAAVFAGTVSPGNIVVVRDIVDGGKQGDIDTALFSDLRENYEVTTVPSGAAPGAPGSVTTVRHLTGAEAGEGTQAAGDGIDTLRNIEKIVFADSERPAAPTSVTAVAGNASATVNWSAPTGSVATGYNVKVMDAAGNQVGLLRQAPAGSTSLVVDKLVNGSAYSVQVQAFNAAGPGPFSVTSGPVTPQPVVPDAPTIGTPVGDSGEAVISWTTPGNGGSNITGYSVRVVDPAGNQVGHLRPADASATSLQLVGLPAGSDLRFQVAATNAVGTGAFSPLSAILPATVTPFADVGQNHQFFTEIVWLADKGITTGFPDGTFHPLSSTNRSAMAAFMYRFAGSPTVTLPEESPFTDVPTNHQFFKEIMWFKDQGITNGFTATTFAPEMPVNRKDMAAFIYRMANEPEYTPPGDSPFTDVSTSGQFYKEIAWLASTGITTGFPDRTYHPMDNVHRDAMAAFLYRYNGLFGPPVP